MSHAASTKPTKPYVIFDNDEFDWTDCSFATVEEAIAEAKSRAQDHCCASFTVYKDCGTYEYKP